MANALGLTVLVVLWIILVRWAPPGDAHIYWSTELDATLYASAWNQPDAYVYPPPFAQLLAPLTALPYPVFYALWSAAMIAALGWMAGIPLAGLLAIPWEPIRHELAAGNVNLLVGLAILLGFRWPGAWAFVLLTKVTPGVGLLWFAVRREWRSLAIALGATAVIAVISFVLGPALWEAWIRRMLTDLGVEPHPSAIVLLPLPLWLRLIIASVIAVWAARTDRPWAVVIAAWVALPLATLMRASMLIAVVPLLFGSRRFLLFGPQQSGGELDSRLR